MVNLIKYEQRRNKNIYLKVHVMFHYHKLRKFIYDYIKLINIQNYICKWPKLYIYF